MKPISFKNANTIYAKDQPEYLPLVVHKDEGGTVTSLWKLTPFERLKILFTGRLWLQNLTFNRPLQPQLPSVNNPLE